MQIRASILTFAKIVAIATAGAACGASPGKIMADTPALPYQAPDVDEISGVDSDAEPGEGSGAGSAQAPQK